MHLDVASIICQTLLERGVKLVFGLPGTLNVPLLEAFRNSRLRFVTTSHELAASFMAIGCFRRNGKPALLTTIPGPGFTYALSGIAEAAEDSCALIYLLVLPSNRAQKTFFLHDLRHEEIIRSMVKESFNIQRPSEAAEVISRAYDVSLNDEPGPVFVTIPANLIEEPTSLVNIPPGAFSSDDNQRLPKEEVWRCAQELLNSERPLLFIGMGAWKSSSFLHEFCLKHKIPAFCTLSGRGIIPADHAMHLPVDFSYGTPKAFQRFLRKMDCMLALGCKFSHNGTGGYSMMLSGKKIIKVNSCKAHLSANYPPTLAVHARVEKFLPLLAQQLGDFKTRWTDEELQQLRRDLEKEIRSKAHVFPSILKSPVQDFFAALRQVLPRESVIVTDSGLHQVMTRQFFPVFCPAGLIAPSDFQSMGFALPAALGVALCETKHPVVCLVGDGGFNISALESLTALREKLNLLILVFRDGYFGQIRLQQISRYGVPFGVEFYTPRYRELASALDIKYFKLYLPMSECLRQCLQVEGVKLMEVLLEDSPELSRISLVSSAKAKVRQLVGPASIRSIKKLMKFGDQ